MAERKQGRSFVVGALIGGILGALWAIWNAPRSGEETRRAIQQAVDEQVNDVRRQVAGESLEEVLAEGKATARALNKR
jgi:gas vesicle protein